MALSAQAALLDELMGKNRNAVPGQVARVHEYSDRDVCKHFLCGFCPHELFVNTRADLGPCHLMHDESLRKSYESSDQYGRLGYEEAFEALLRRLLNEVERRIRKGEERLRLTQSDEPSSSLLLVNSADAMLPPNQVRLERLRALNEQINSLIQESERFGMNGDIENAKEVLTRIEKLKSERYELETRLPGNDNVKAMEVCTVCGSFLIVGDAQCRVDEHITGKQHVGYARIRETLENLRKKRESGAFCSATAATAGDDSKMAKAAIKSDQHRYYGEESGERRRHGGGHEYGHRSRRPPPAHHQRPFHGGGGGGTNLDTQRYRRHSRSPLHSSGPAHREKRSPRNSRRRYRRRKSSSASERADNKSSSSPPPPPPPPQTTTSSNNQQQQQQQRMTRRRN